MNTAYRVVWNCAKHVWEVASELTGASRCVDGRRQLRAGVAETRWRQLPWAVACVLAGAVICAPSLAHAADGDILSPKLATDAQIASVLAHRQQAPQAAPRVVSPVVATVAAQAPPTRVAAPASVVLPADGAPAPTQRRAPVTGTRQEYPVAPAVAVIQPAVVAAPSVTVAAAVPQRLAPVVVRAADPDAGGQGEPGAPGPLPAVPAAERQVAALAPLKPRVARSAQTSGLKQGTPAKSGEPDIAAAGNGDAVADSASDPVGTQAALPPSTDAARAYLVPMAMASGLGVTPMVIPPGSPSLPPPPESPPPGLVIGTAGLIGGTGATINPVTGALLNPADPNYEAGALTLSKDNVTAAFGGGITLTVLGLPVTVPISVQNTLTAADGTLFSTGANQHLTLLGGVHSQNYITNINNGATTGGILDPTAPAWADSCLNVNIAGLLGVNVPCWGVNAAQNNQVLIGDGATANGSEEVVIGTGASHVLAPVDANTLFPGDGNRNSTTNPMGVPDANYQGREGHSVVIGDSATGTQNWQTIVGANATSDQPNSIALGYGSNADRGPQSGYSAFGLLAPQNSAGEVAVGNTGNNRQITHVAAGSAATDAVNVAQLQGAVAGANATDKLAVKYDADASGDPTNQVTLAGDGTGAPVGIGNLAPGALNATSTAAVNGSQLFATNTTLAQYFGGSTAYDGGTNTWTPPNFTITNIDAAGNSTAGSYNNVTDAFSALDTSLTNVNSRIVNNTANLKYFQANSTGSAAVASGTDSVAMGGDTAATGVGSVAAGSGAQAQAGGAVAVGQNAGASGGQAVAVGSGATAAGDGAVAVGNGSSATGLGAMAFGTAAGASADGALAIGNGASATVDGAVALGTGSIASRAGGGVEAFTGLAVPQVGAISIGAPNQTRQITNVAGGTADTDAVNVGQLKAVAGQVNGLSDLAVKYDADASGNPVNTVTLLGNGSGAPVLITNLAAGVESASSTDAINGSQLYHWTQDPTNIYSNVNLYKDIQNIYNGGAFVVNDTNGLGPATASGNNSAAGGAGTVAAGTDSTAVGNGAEAKGANSVALGAGSVANRDNVVSVGSQGHERQVTNVAAGTAQTDAVNVAQLDASQAGTVRYDTNPDGSVDYGDVTLGGPGGNAGPTVIHNVGAGVAGTDAVNMNQLEGVQNWAKQYTDLRINDMQGQVTNLGHRAFAGIASAMAMAGLPQAYLPGKSMASVAASSFHGESSLAVGVSVISNNGRWVYKLSGTGDSRGDAGVTIGAGIQW